MTPSALRTHAYAGLALTYQGQAQGLTGTRRQERQQQAQDLRNLVLQQDAEGFQASSLGRNWLWTPETISAWQQLGQP